MATLGWLQFRDLCRFRLICITHKAIGLYMEVPEYISNRDSIRATTRPSRKCELMTILVPFISYMYADAAFTLLLRSTVTVFPMTYGPYHLLLLSNVDYIHMFYHYNVFFNNLLLFVYLFVLL